MNNIIRQLSQIEANSVQILENGIARKKELAAEYEEKTKNFDLSLNRETEEKIAALRRELEDSMNAQLKEQEEAAGAAVQRLEKHYEASHQAYVSALFKKMTEV